MPNALRKTSHVVALSLVAASLTLAAVASAKLAKSGGANAGFKASGPAGMNIEGTTSDVAVGDDGSTVTIAVGLGSLSTGIGLRDKHMKEYLETDKYPTAELKVARSALKIPAPGGDASGDARGTMKLHGQTKAVTFHYTAKRDGDVINVSGAARVNMNDYGIKTPSYLGVSVKPDVDVSARFAARDN
ncbi:MAG TPA: YceI family protein [Minicystis sp.]|nr:YceI family protein [Minicystis sp.]